MGAPSFERRTWSAASEELHLAGPNVLTITYNGFSNAAHKDRDKCPQAYGKWWTGSKTTSDSGIHYSHETVSHQKVRGGGFYLPEYGILVDFEKCVSHFCLGAWTYTEVVRDIVWLRCFGVDVWTIMSLLE